MTTELEANDLRLELADKLGLTPIVLAGMVWMAEAIAESDDLILSLKIFGSLGISIMTYYFHLQASA